MGQEDTVEWDRLKHLAIGWVSDTLRRLQRQRSDMPERQECFYRMGETCLMSIREYVDTAFEAFVAQRFHSGLTSCRTVFELGVHLLWCALDKSGGERRPDQVYKKLLQQDHKFFKDCGVVFGTKGGATDWVEAADEAKKQIDELRLDASIPHMHSMIRTIQKESQGKLAFPSLYPAVYGVLCGSSHGTLPLFKQYTHRGAAVVVKMTPDMPRYTVLLALTAVIYLVAGPHAFFGWKEEWEIIMSQYEESLPPEARGK